jgi:hypothetical protein
VALAAVHAIDREVLAPVFTPVGSVVTLYCDDELADGLGQIANPFVVLVGVVIRRREQFDHGAERSLRAQNGACGATAARGVFVDAGEVSAQYFVDDAEVVFEIADEDAAFEDDAGERFRNFGFAAAGDGARLVAENAIGARGGEAPRRAARLLFEPDLGTPRKHVDFAWAQHELAFSPFHAAFASEEIRIARDVIDAGEVAIDGVTLGAHFDAVAKQLHRIFVFDGLGEHGAAGVEFPAENVGRKRDGAARMFLLAIAEEIGGVADLGFDFLLAVTVIVIGDDCDDHAARIAGGELEG